MNPNIGLMDLFHHEANLWNAQHPIVNGYGQNWGNPMKQFNEFSNYVPEVVGVGLGWHYLSRNLLPRSLSWPHPFIPNLVSPQHKLEKKVQFSVCASFSQTFIHPQLMLHPSTKFCICQLHNFCISLWLKCLWAKHHTPIVSKQLQRLDFPKGASPGDQWSPHSFLFYSM